MKVCFPVHENKGLESRVYGHFGSALIFVVVDTESGALMPINNNDLYHEHGACNPLRALNGNKVDAIVVGGIGGGALNKLNQAGIRVYQAQSHTVGKNLDLFISGSLPEFVPGHTCAGHGGGCSH